MQGRRSTRLPTVFPVTLSGLDIHGVAFKENTWTLGVNKHGALLSTSHRLGVGGEIDVDNPVLGRGVRAHVTRVIERERDFEIGVELIDPQNVWGVKNPPRDWKESDAAGESSRNLEEASVAASTPQREDSESTPAKDDGMPSGTPGAEDAVANGQPGALTSQNGPPLPSSPEESAIPVEDRAKATESPRFDQLAEFMRTSSAELEGLLARTQEIQQKSYQALQLVVEEVHGKLRHELESISAVFVEEARQRLRHETSEALEVLGREANARLAALSQDALAKSLAAQQRIDLSLKDGAEEFQRKLIELSSAALEELKHNGDALFGGFRDDLQKWLDELKSQVASDVSGHLRQSTADLAEELQHRAGVSLETLREQFTGWGRERVEETEKQLAAATQSALVTFAQRSSETVHQQVDVAAGTLNEAAEQATARLESNFQQSLAVFQKQVSELSEAILKDHCNAFELLLQGLHNRLDQAARALMQGGASRPADDPKPSAGP